MNTVILYRLSLEENLFVFYKFSNQAPYIRTIHVGKIYHNDKTHFSRSRKLERLLKKYNIKENAYGFELIDGYDEFLRTVFLHNLREQIIPDKCVKVCQKAWRDSEKSFATMSLEEIKETQRNPPFLTGEVLEEIEKELDKI